MKFVKAMSTTSQSAHDWPFECITEAQLRLHTLTKLFYPSNCFRNFLIAWAWKMAWKETLLGLVIVYVLDKHFPYFETLSKGNKHCPCRMIAPASAKIMA